MFSRTNIYTVHVKPDSISALENPVFVREGFYMMALLFGAVWALYHRCYYFAGLIVAVFLALAMAVESGVLSEPAAAITQLGIQVMIGFHAGDMLRDRLRRQGYIIQDMASGSSLLLAQQRYFDRWATA